MTQPLHRARPKRLLAETTQAAWAIQSGILQGLSESDCELKAPSTALGKSAQVCESL